MSSAPVRDPLSDNLIAPDVSRRALGRPGLCRKILTAMVTTEQSTKNMEYVRLLLKHKATRIFRDAGIGCRIGRTRTKKGAALLR